MTNMEQSEKQIQALEHKVRILHRLAEISAVLNSTLDLDTLLGALMDAATEITDAEAASVLLWDEKLQELTFTATNTQDDDRRLIGQSVPLEGSIAGTILRNNRIMQVDNVAADPRHYDKVDKALAFQTRSLLGVPMTIQDRPVGVLEILNKRQLPWTDEDREYAQVLAAQAAVAIRDAQTVAALQKANAELNELDKLKNDFIAIASHELRTPLAIILGYASFLQEEAEGKLSEHAAKVLASGLQLRRIIEELTNLRYLQQSASELVREPLPLDELVDDAVHDVLSLAEAKGHKLTLTLPDDVTVQVDRIRSAMALTSIVNNAVRFTPDGGQIGVKAEVRGKEAWITVTDNGMGIDAEHIERIFEKFYQVEDHMTRTYGGLGIGLSIARATVEAHGGRVWAESAGLGQGAAFTMTLPLAE